MRGRDLLSVVNEAQAAVAPLARTGYLVQWGGQFQNFIEARNRLAVVVLLALGLIL